MRSAAIGTPPPDQRERVRALDTSRSILVRAPAGSGKTDLLTRRFLRLLGEVDDPGQIVAITFTKAAAAEMRHRILAELEQAAARENAEDNLDDFAMEALAQRALARSQALGWNLVDLHAQLRISTIDSFCRELAMQRPLLSSLGGSLDIGEQPTELYRRAARRTLESIDGNDAVLRESIEALLLWRDNRWHEIEDQLVRMLATRDRWMHGFVLDRDPDWEALRERLEAPFRHAARHALTRLSEMLDQAPHARAEALELARFACTQGAAALFQELAELAEFPATPFGGGEELDEAQRACACLARLLLTGGQFRKQVDKRHGFPAENKPQKARLLSLIADLRQVPDLESALAAIAVLPDARYTDDDWRIVRACFALLRRAAAELQVIFAEAACADYIEVAQIAESVLRGDNEIPSEAALAVADGIRHLLVDEFQDTSRRQHQLLARLIAAWDAREGRTCFVVGDPMQSIYFFRDADAELFPRAERMGLEVPHDLPLELDAIRLFANFRTARPLVTRLNEFFFEVFRADDGSGVSFAHAEPARTELLQHEDATAADRTPQDLAPRMELHVEFVPGSVRAASSGNDAATTERIASERDAALEKQTAEIVEVVRKHLPAIESARVHGEKFRVAILGRTHKALAPIAAALREAQIPFRAVELEELRERPEILDALALARALVNPQDRVAWLGVLRAPWCGLSLADLHTLASGDDPELIRRPVPDLITEPIEDRLQLLSPEGRLAVQRVAQVIESLSRLRFAQPAASLGTWIEQVWLALGGAHCVDEAAQANLDLFWRALDSLPEGEQNIFGSALDAALTDLKALPDPHAESERGVQLMTIHKSKGLEFEVVIVPDMQARTTRGGIKLLSWLERGIDRGVDDSLAEPDGSGEITEFLVAPLQSKGAEGGATRRWVEAVYHERESQEMRRLLYVAATRAREELHLFARPAYKTEHDGSLTLPEPRESLLRTAWPALEADIRARFDAWRAPHAAQVAALAASGDNVQAIRPSDGGTRLRRLPADVFTVGSASLASSVEPHIAGAGTNIARLYERHEGGVLSRALGVAVHTLLQELARLDAHTGLQSARAWLARMEPQITAQVRGTGIERQQAARTAAQAVEIALQAAQDATGQWILSAHADAASEVRWAGVVAGKLRTVQVDRVFRAGAGPRTDGSDVWWVIDYKTAHEASLNPQDSLPKLRAIFAPQIEAYAQVLRNLHGQDAKIYGGLYYPRMMLFDWWEM